jgi:predicted RND superfamily exporter protein
MGKTSALVVLAIYLYVTILIPILLSFGKDRAPKASCENGATKLDTKFSTWSNFVYKRKKPFIVATALIIIAFIPGMFKITAQLDYLTITGDKMPYIREVKEMLAHKLGNQYSYTVMISYDEEGSFKKPENMKALLQLEDYLGTLSLTKWSGGKARVTSATSILKEMNRALNEGKDSFYTVPEDEYVLAQLMELSSIEMRQDFSDAMDEDFKTTIVNVDMTQFATEEALANMNSLRAKLAELFPGAKCTLLGDMIRYSEMSNRIIFGGLKSFGFSLVIIAIMLIFAFSSLKLGLIGMIPNIAPVILVGGVMGYFNFALDFSTITVMPLVLGIAVDDTIHLTTHLKMRYEQYGSCVKAMEATFREIGSTMFLTTVILCSMFSVYLFSPMRFLAVLGLLTILGLSSALVADYTITPALLHVAKPFGKEKEEA